MHVAIHPPGLIPTHDLAPQTRSNLIFHEMLLVPVNNWCHVGLYIIIFIIIYNTINDRSSPTDLTAMTETAITLVSCLVVSGKIFGIFHQKYWLHFPSIVLNVK